VNSSCFFHAVLYLNVFADYEPLLKNMLSKISLLIIQPVTVRLAPIHFLFFPHHYITSQSLTTAVAR